MTIADRYRKIIIIFSALTILIALNMGVLAWCGISVSYSKLVCEALAYIIFFVSLYINHRDTLAITHAILFILPLAACGTLGLVVSINSPDGIKGGILFVRWIMSYVLFGAGLLIIAPKYKELKIIRLIIAYFILFQPVVAVVKLLTLGIGESPWIGTLHQSAGQFGVLLPLIAVSYLLPIFLIFNNKTSLLLILAFIFFSIVYEKRAALYLLPFWFMMIYVIYAVLVILNKNLKKEVINKAITEMLKCAAVIAICFISFIIISLFSPSLNPQEKIGGDFSPTHIVNYTRGYMFKDFDHPMNLKESGNTKSNNDKQIGRFKAIVNLWQFMKGQPTGRFLFGFGGGYVNSSHLMGVTRTDILFERTGVRSSVPAAINLLIETGLVGVTIVIIWFAGVALLLIKSLKIANSKNTLNNSLSMVALFTVIAFDFFVYSSVLWTAGVMTPLLFAVLGAEFGRLRIEFNSKKYTNEKCLECANNLVLR